MKELIHFLQELKANNNRTWFNEHKDWYLEAKESFDRLIGILIERIAAFDPPIASAEVRESVFRIYRDIRFSANKLPYKEQFSAFIAFPNGWKSRRSGYYIHLEPGKSFFSAGIYRPDREVLTALRKSVADNYEEFDALLSKSSFRKTFGDTIYESEKLKRLPAGFSGEFDDPKLIKLKHFLVRHSVPEEVVGVGDLVAYLTDLAQEAAPFNQFLNFTVDEMDDLSF